jgi:hypothetical protein
MVCIWEEAGDTGMFKDFRGFEINDKNAVAINVVDIQNNFPSLAT